MNRRNELVTRARIVQVFFALLSLLMLFRVFNVAVLERGEWLKKGVVNLKLMPVYAERGNILADDGKLLSTSLRYYETYCDVMVVDKTVFANNVDELAGKLNKVIGIRSKEAWLKKLISARKNEKRYLSISKKTTLEQYNALKKFPIFKLGRYQGGFVAKAYGKRVKPFGGLASRTIGEHRDEKMKGLERYYDKALKGKERKILMKKVNSTTWIPEEDMDYLTPERGMDVVTTINVNMQDIVQSELKERLEYLNADMGTAVLMEVKTGAVKAMVNLSKLKSGKYHEISNIAVLEKRDPGSTIKLASVMAMLDHNYVDLESKVNLNGGKTRIYRQDLYDSHPHNTFETTVKYAFEQSSNVGIGSLANKFYNSKEGRVKFINKFKEFGLGKVSGIDLYGEKPPYLKDPQKKSDNWSGLTIPWMAHGYEYLVTPLQMLKFYNAVANDGKMMKPYLVSELVDDDGNKKIVQPVVESESIAKASTIKKAKTLLRGAVVNGTGKHHLVSDLVEISGKTGTAVVNYVNKSEKTRYNASFAGFFPSKDPKYSMIIMVYNPRAKEHFGGNAVGPAYRKIAERIMSFDNKDVFATPNVKSYDLPHHSAGFKNDFTEIFDYARLSYSKPSGNWVSVNPREGKMIVDKKSIKTALVPNVIGMGARDAIYVLENIGMQVNVSGVGHVVEQSIDPGTANKGQAISIKLK